MCTLVDLGIAKLFALLLSNVVFNVQKTSVYLIPVRNGPKRHEAHVDEHEDPESDDDPWCNSFRLGGFAREHHVVR